MSRLHWQPKASGGNVRCETEFLWTARWPASSHEIQSWQIRLTRAAAARKKSPLLAHLLIGSLRAVESESCLACFDLGVQGMSRKLSEGKRHHFRLQLDVQRVHQQCDRTQEIQKKKKTVRKMLGHSEAKTHARKERTNKKKTTMHTQYKPYKAINAHAPHKSTHTPPTTPRKHHCKLLQTHAHTCLSPLSLCVCVSVSRSLRSLSPLLLAVALSLFGFGAHKLHHDDTRKKAKRFAGFAGTGILSSY